MSHRAAGRGGAGHQVAPKGGTRGGEAASAWGAAGPRARREEPEEGDAGPKGATAAWAGRRAGGGCRKRRGARTGQDRADDRRRRWRRSQI